MYSKRAVIVNKTGLHARPASVLTMKAMEYKSFIAIKNLDNEKEKLINAKSIMKILAASITVGTNIEISAEGEDERMAVEELVKLVESGFAK